MNYAPAQEMCLVSMDGAGAEYMPLFDYLHPAVRDRLRNCEKNLCLECLCERVENIEGRRRFECHPETYFKVIREFETGDFRDHRNRIEGPRSFDEERSLRWVYESTDYPSPNFYDPRRWPQRYPEYPSARELQRGMVEWERERRAYDDLGNYGQGTAVAPPRLLKIEFAPIKRDPFRFR